jgi:hypothetical protein
VHDRRKVMQNLIEHILKNNNDIKIKLAALGKDSSCDNDKNFK